MCRCVSIMPGVTMPPVASISTVPSGTASLEEIAGGGVIPFPIAGAVYRRHGPRRPVAGGAASCS